MQPIPEEFWIVVTQYDTDATGFSRSGPPRGPLVHESFCLTQQEAEERANYIGSRYGWVTILKVKAKDVS
jgi:hypothetical protein